MKNIKEERVGVNCATASKLLDALFVVCWRHENGICRFTLSTNHNLCMLVFGRVADKPF